MTKQTYLEIFEGNIRETDYIDMDYESIVNVLKEFRFGDAESKVLASAVKYLASQRSYVKPNLSKSALRRIDRFWGMHTMDEIISTLGDTNVSKLYMYCGLYNREYIKYLLKENPALLYTDDTHFSSDLDLKRVHISKFAEVLYKDYLDIRDKEI